MAPLMPLVHICDCYALRGILSSKAIKPTMCPVFNEELLYFFYGRPSYRINDGGLSFGSKSMFPVCFIINPAYAVDIKRIFPFDTGAYYAGLYKDHVHKSAACDDYMFDSTYEFIQKYVSMFYGTNTNYYNGTATIALDKLPVMGFEFQSLHSLITQQGACVVDDRSYTIEIQCSGETNISNGSVIAVVLPDDIMSDEVLSSFLYDNDIEPITYKSARGAPSHITPLIIDLVRNYYEQEGVV
ncbi:hypothetical protein PS934_04554 [Pseudomonas fluorescens]|nr:hypothetical protein PS934_04554 [Pseudomonas fluorescens]